jgi:hypothetical protein
MSKSTVLTVRIVIGVLSIMACVVPALAVPMCPAGPGESEIPCVPIQYHGGPFLQGFTIHPVYMGKWSKADIDKQQTFLTHLTEYISGKNAPAGQQPVLKQYGVGSASVAAAVHVDLDLEPSQYVSTCLAGSIGTYGGHPPPLPAVAGNLYFCDIPQIIAKNQAAKKIPGYGPETVIMLLPATGFSLDPTCSCGGYHSSLSSSSFFGVIAPGPDPSDQEPYEGAISRYQVITSHEVFEASTDPSDNQFNGWDEVADQCNTFVTLDWPGGVKLQFAAIIDDTANHSCTTTGYTSLDEIQDYGVTYSTYLAEYNTLWNEGYRLYILQSYVLENGEVLYNAVWRPMGDVGEIQQYGVTFDEYHSEYDTLFPEGWRIYILQSYVLPNGQVLYNAVYRPGNLLETQAYGVTYDEFRSEYNSLYPSPGYWRLYILQSYVTPSGEVLYNAVWREPDQHVSGCACSNELQVYGWSYADYRADYNKLWSEGWRLYLLDSYVLANGTVSYNAVWRPATHGEIQVYDNTYEQYRTEYNKLWSEGWRLYSLTTYVLPGDNVRYDAVFRTGTFDRPL